MLKIKPPASSNMQQRSSDRNRPFKQYNPNPAEFDAQGNPQGQSQGLAQDQLEGQSLFEFDDASLLSLLGQQGQGDGMNSDMMHGAGLPMGSMNPLPGTSQAGDMQLTSMSSTQVSSAPLSIPSSSSGSAPSDMYSSNFLTGLGGQDQDISSFLSGMSSSMHLPGGMSPGSGGMMSQQAGGMMSQQAGGMVLSGHDSHQSHCGMGQMSGNGPPMPPMQYSSDMNMTNFNAMKEEKPDDIFHNPSGSSVGSSKADGNGNRNSASSPESPNATLNSDPHSPSNTSRDDGYSGVEGESNSKSSKKRLHNVPDEQKDEAYWEKRRKNNESAKRSREARRMKEEQIAMRVVVLEQENLALKTEIGILETEVDNLRHMLYNTAPPPPNHMQ